MHSSFVLSLFFSPGSSHAQLVEPSLVTVAPPRLYRREQRSQRFLGASVLDGDAWWDVAPAAVSAPAADHPPGAAPSAAAAVPAPATSADRMEDVARAAVPSLDPPDTHLLRAPGLVGSAQRHRATANADARALTPPGAAKSRGAAAVVACDGPSRARHAASDSLSLSASDSGREDEGARASSPALVTPVDAPDDANEAAPDSEPPRPPECWSPPLLKTPRPMDAPRTAPAVAMAPPGPLPHAEHLRDRLRALRHRQAELLRHSEEHRW